MKHIEEYPIKVKFTKSFTTTAIETTTQNGEKYLEVGDKIRFLEENDIHDVQYFNENFIICLSPSNVCTIIDLKYNDGGLDIDECKKILKELNIENEINFNDVVKMKIKNVKKQPKPKKQLKPDIDYPSKAFEYTSDIDTSFLDSNAYYSYLNG